MLWAIFEVIRLRHSGNADNLKLSLLALKWLSPYHLKINGYQTALLHYCMIFPYSLVRGTTRYSRGE